MTLSTEHDMFILYVNQMNFYKLPYKFDLTKESDSGVKYQAVVQFDEKNITLPEPWNNQEFYKNFLEIFGATDFNFSRALVKITQSNSSAVVNEVFDSMVEFCYKETGLVELNIAELPSEA